MEIMSTLFFFQLFACSVLYLFSFLPLFRLFAFSVLYLSPFLPLFSLFSLFPLLCFSSLLFLFLLVSMHMCLYRFGVFSPQEKKKSLAISNKRRQRVFNVYAHTGKKCIIVMRYMIFLFVLL